MSGWTKEEREYQDALKAVKDCIADIDSARGGVRAGYVEMVQAQSSELGRLVELTRFLVGLLRD